MCHSTKMNIKEVGFIALRIGCMLLILVGLSAIKVGWSNQQYIGIGAGVGIIALAGFGFSKLN